MENISSSDLDSPSKTPFFIAIAAVIVALLALYLGWMGFSRATELEKQIARLETALSEGSGLEEAVQANTDKLDKVATNMNGFSKNVNTAINDVSDEIAKLKSYANKIAIEAGTAKKMVEELEKKGVQVAVVPQKSTSSSASVPAAKKTPDTAPGKSGVYTIKSGDNFSKVAAAYKVTLSELEAANPGVDSRRLRIGQQIVIPAPSN